MVHIRSEGNTFAPARVDRRFLVGRVMVLMSRISARGAAVRDYSMMDLVEPTFTPTTRRISKAKKGKRVHLCDQCGKVSRLTVVGARDRDSPQSRQVFTRAEHLR